MGTILWTLRGFIVGFIVGITACAMIDGMNNGDAKSPYGYY
jgi:hypothetical protein